MNNQKDTQKTDANTRPLGGDLTNFDSRNALNSSVYDFANKKTEKLVTALYLVSDCMDTDDALKGKIRLLGVELLSDIYKLSTLSPVEKHNYIGVSLNHIYELLSFIEIAYTIGFISEMNTMILKKEFANLATDLKSSQSKDKHFTFTLDEKMFELPELQSGHLSGEDLNYKGDQSIKDKRTSFNTMPARPIGVSFINNKSPLSNSQLKKTNSSATNSADRQDRTNKILSLIKGKVDISIKDISLAFTNCSEKTIQRELNSLVIKGQLKKTGAKRWSRYSIVNNFIA
jgi:hypothetical protein